MSNMSTQTTDTPTKIVEVTKAVKEFTLQNGRSPSVEDLEQKYLREESVRADVKEAIDVGCLETDDSGRLFVTRAGDDCVTAKIYPASKIFECKSSENRFGSCND